MTTPKIGIILAIVLATLCIAWIYFQPLRVQVYTFDSEISSRWVAIEYNRGDCSPLNDGSLYRSIFIPADGYVCTSSDSEQGWTYNLFGIDERGDWRRLSKDENIRLRSMTQVNEPLCQIQAETFLLKLNDSDDIPNDSTSFIRTYHPRCIRGTETIARP